MNTKKKVFVWGYTSWGSSSVKRIFVKENRGGERKGVGWEGGEEGRRRKGGHYITGKGLGMVRGRIRDNPGPSVGL